jgi:acyl dehydratase
VSEAPVGKAWPPSKYEVGLEKIREYAHAIGATERVHHDRDAARAAGFRDVVAPPMFAVVYSAGAVAPAIFDPEVGIELPRMLHGSQEFAWGEPVCAGDTIETAAELRDAYEKDGRKFFVFETVSRNQDGEEVVRGTWTNIVR